MMGKLIMQCNIKKHCFPISKLTQSMGYPPCFCSQLTAQPSISCSILPSSAASECSPIRLTSGSVKSLMCWPRIYMGTKGILITKIYQYMKTGLSWCYHVVLQGLRVVLPVTTCPYKQHICLCNLDVTVGNDQIKMKTVVQLFLPPGCSLGCLSELSLDC